MNVDITFRKNSKDSPDKDATANITFSRDNVSSKTRATNTAKANGKETKPAKLHIIKERAVEAESSKAEKAQGGGAESVKTAAQAEREAKPAVKKKTTVKARRPKRLKWAVLSLFFIVIVAGVYESLAQSISPQMSLLAALHRYGILTSVPVIYKPSRSIWRPMGWTGSAMMLTMMLYSVRKRFHSLARFGSLRSWLRFHIFLGLMGPLLITFHTTMKFNGIISTSFYAMLITVFFGIMGRYIYSQIPRSLSGATLKTNEIDSLVMNLDNDLSKHLGGKNISELTDIISLPGSDGAQMNPLKALGFYIKNDIGNFFRVLKLKKSLKKDYNLAHSIRGEIISLMKKKSALVRRRNLLSSSQKLFNYWHVVHIPLAILMFTIMFIHIAAYFIFRPVV